MKHNKGNLIKKILFVYLMKVSITNTAIQISLGYFKKVFCLDFFNFSDYFKHLYRKQNIEY
jgi:hypothetical protein